MHAEIHTIESFLEKTVRVPVADVRTPMEYEKGHIPGARLYPLFSNEERAEIGKLYALKGHDTAVQKGMEMVGPRLNRYVDHAQAMAPDKEILLYCWRGGMRSASLGWLLQTAGFKVGLLEGGYRTYRRYLHALFEKRYRLYIIGGYTGSGKTSMLEKLREKGEQVINLERLAAHKGSTFGWIGEHDQPSQEQFENELGWEWMKLDPGCVTWLEDESINIGKVQIPLPLFRLMQHSQMILLKTGIESRIEKLVSDYSMDSKDALVFCFQQLEKRMGGERSGEAIKAVQTGDFRTAAFIALQYYDKAYGKLLDKRTGMITTLQAEATIDQTVSALTALVSTE